MGRGITGKMKERVNPDVSPEWNWVQSTCGNDGNTAKVESYLKIKKHIRIWEYVESYNIVGPCIYARVGSNRKPSYNITIKI